MVIKTDIVHINSRLDGKEEAVLTADEFNRYNHFTGKNALHIRLLTEELISMVHDIMDGFIGNLWLESHYTDDGVKCRICLSSQRVTDVQREKKLLSVATTGKNENSRGILGKIREVLRINAQYSDDSEFMNRYAESNSWYSMGRSPEERIKERYWSLKSYQNNLPADRSEAPEEWDELERSIIAKLADDVEVWLTDETTEVVINKLIG